MGKMRAELLWKSFVSRHQGPVWLWAKIFLLVRGKIPDERERKLKRSDNNADSSNKSPSAAMSKRALVLIKVPKFRYNRTRSGPSHRYCALSSAG